MGNLFGGGADSPADPAPARAAAKPSISEKDKAMLKLKGQKDKLKQFERRANARADSQKKVAQRLAKAGKRKEAMMVLKQKKLIEKQLADCSNQMFQLEQLIGNIEMTGMQQKFLEGMKAGNEALKQMQADMGGVEGVESLLEETEEAHATLREIEAALAGRDGVMDDAATEAELAELEELMALEVSQAIPDAPTTDVGAQEPAQREPAAQPKMRQAVPA